MYSGPHRRYRITRRTLALLIFIKKDVCNMRAVDRLVALGIDPECAVDTALWYAQQGDEEGLEDYVRKMEDRLRKDKQE